MDFFGRVRSFLEAAGPVGASLFFVVLLFLAVLALMGKRWWLLAVFVVALMFSGYYIPAVDSGSTLLRWLVIFLLALSCVRGVKSPGVGAIMIGSMAIWGMLTSPMALSLSWAMQKTGLMFAVAILMGAAVADQIRAPKDIRILLWIILAGAGLYAVLGLSSLGTLRGVRYAGAITSAPLFVLTGGLLLPVALWGALTTEHKAGRTYCIAVGIVILLLCVVSGQRTGSFAGFIACTPLAIARFGIKKVLLAGVVIGVAATLTWAVLGGMPAQKEFVMGRFFSLDTTGRVERWLGALDACMQEPFLGHGIGSYVLLGFSPHNAFLVVWYNLGLLGLVLFGGAMIAMAFQAFGLMVRGPIAQTREIGRLFFGIMLGTIAAAFFEIKLNSPSNIAIFFIVMTSVILGRMKVFLREAKGPVEASDRHLQAGAEEYDFGQLVRQYYGS